MILATVRGVGHQAEQTAPPVERDHLAEGGAGILRGDLERGSLVGEGAGGIPGRRSERVVDEGALQPRTRALVKGGRCAHLNFACRLFL